MRDFDELLTRPFTADVNALCWTRVLDGDFAEVARVVAPASGLVVIDEGMLRALPLTPAGRIAADTMCADLRRLDGLGREPVLNCITAYPRDARGLPIAADVMSFHVDRAPHELDTWLCTYHGASSEALAPGDARPLVNDADVRSELLRTFGGVDDERFAAWLRDESFDLHHAAVRGAEPYRFGVGNLWRIAVSWPGATVPPCVHRAPDVGHDDAPRLLLIA